MALIDATTVEMSGTNSAVIMPQCFHLKDEHRILIHLNLRGKFIWKQRISPYHRQDSGNCLGRYCQNSNSSPIIDLI